MKNEATGEVFAIDAEGRINGGDLPSKSEGRMGGYKLDGSRITPSGMQGDQAALNNQAPTWADERRQWQSRQPVNSGQVSSVNANRVINGQPQQQQRGWKSQLAIDTQAMENRQSGINTFINNQTERERNKIAMMTANSNAKKDNFEMSQAQTKADMLKEYSTTTDPAKKSELGKILEANGSIKKPTTRIIDKPVTNEYNDVVGKDHYMVDEDGNSKKIDTPQEQPKPSTEQLKMLKDNIKNKKYRDWFVEAFGSLPEGY
jgi:hypothetical protein